MRGKESRHVGLSIVLKSGSLNLQDPSRSVQGLLYIYTFGQLSADLRNSSRQ